MTQPLSHFKNYVSNIAHASTFNSQKYIYEKLCVIKIIRLGFYGTKVSDTIRKTTEDTLNNRN